MADFSMSNSLVLDSLDPVEAVLKTDEDFAAAIAAAEAKGNFDETIAIKSLKESGDIIDSEEDEQEVDEKDLDESTFDITNLVDLSMITESSGESDSEDDDDDELITEDDDFDYDDDDIDIVDEVMDSVDDTDPESVGNKEDGEIIDAVDADAVDDTGYQIEGTFTHNPFISSLLEDADMDCDDDDCTTDTAEMADDDDEPITEDDDLLDF